MPTLTWYVTNTDLAPHQRMDETSPGAEATSSPNIGWTVGTVAAGNYSKFNSGVEQASTTFATTPVEPDGSLDTSLGDCWRSQNTYTGTFDTGNWTFQLRAIAVTNGGSQDGNAGFRLFRGAAANGSDAVEITSARQEGSVVTNLATTAAQTSSITVSIGTFSVTNEYIFVQVGWEITGAGGMSNSDVIHRIGNGASLVTSANFTSSGPAAALYTRSLTGVGL